MKKIKKNIYKPLSICLFFTVASFAPLFFAHRDVTYTNDLKSSKNGNKINNINPDKFVSKNYSNPDNYNDDANLVSNDELFDQKFYSDYVSQDKVNDHNLFNRQSVLSNKSLTTVDNHDFYFNFIKPGTDSYTNEDTHFNIVATAKDNLFQINPIFLTTDYISKSNVFNGSAYYSNNRLIIIGNTKNGVELNIYKIASLNEIIKINVNDRPNALFHLEKSQLFTNWLWDAAKQDYKLINTFSQGSTPYNTQYMFEKVPSQPIYMSPVKNFQIENDSKIKLLIWTGSGDNTFNNWNNGTCPIIVTYDINSKSISSQQPNGFSIDNRIAFPKIYNWSSDKIPQNGTWNGNYVDQDILNSRIFNVTPIINDKGRLSIFVYSYLLNTLNITPGIPNSFVILVSKIKIENNRYETKEFLQNPMPVTMRESANYDDFINNDLNAIIPYSLTYKGDKNHPNGVGSHKVNFFYISSQNSFTNTKSVISSFNIDMDNDDNIYSNKNSYIYCQKNGSFVLSNQLNMEQYYYNPMQGNDNLENGIYISTRYRGLFSGNDINLTRLGYIKWIQPWNDKIWSNEAASVPGNIFSPNLNVLDIVLHSGRVGIADDVFSPIQDGNINYVGIFGAQNRNYDQATGIVSNPIWPDKRQQIKSLSRNIASWKNNYNTKINNIIVLPKNDNINPNNGLTNGDITNYIKNTSKNLPNNFSQGVIAYLGSPLYDNNNHSLKVDYVLTQWLDHGDLSFASKYGNTIFYNQPNLNDIENPLIINKKFNLFSSTVSYNDILNHSFTQDGFNYHNGVIGVSKNELIQLNEKMIPFFCNFVTHKDDFLGKIKINYDIKSNLNDQNNDVEQMISNEIIISGFWGNVYFIPIAILSLLIIITIFFVTLFLLKKKHKSNLTKSLVLGMKTANSAAPTKMTGNILPNNGPKPPMGPQVGAPKPPMGPQVGAPKPPMGPQVGAPKPPMGPPIRKG
ncbi:MAG: hypothetical protein ACRCW6_01800 [Mycoplasmoidaceae bacterium]